MASRAHDDPAYSADLERLENLLQAAGARDGIPEPVELSDREWERLANVVGPIVATLYAVALYGRLIARSPGMDPDLDREDLTESNESETALSGQALLSLMAQLVEVVKQDIATLGSYAVAVAGDADSDDPEVDADPDWHWIKVGTNPVYVAIADGRVEAVVYEAGEELGTDDEGQPVVTTPGWFWFPADGSQHHRDLVISEPPTEEDRGSLDPLHDAALEAATEPIERYLARRRAR